MADPIDTGKKTVTGRTIWRDPETGEDYSERSTTFEIDGKYYTMPTVDENGNQYSDDTIREYVKENGPIDFITGEELPEFRYREDAIEYAISRSDTRKQKEEPMLEEQMEMFNEGGLKDEGGEVDPESGNDVPIGSTKKEVRDDIPAMLSEGEFVFPADVVRYIGLEKLMELRQSAKMGLKQMEAMGQMGNSEEATIPDDMPFNMSDLIIVSGEPEDDEPKKMNQGGFATGIGGYQQSVFQNQPQVAAPFVPASSVAPPPPAPSPEGGFMPKFVTNQTTPFDDGSLAPKTNTGTTSTTTTNTGTTGTTDDFVPTVDKVYTQKKYINPETGETRMINFYNNSPVNEIPEGFIPFEDYNPSETTTTDLESTSVETTQVSDDNDKKELTKMVADQERKDATKFKKQLADTIESGSQEDLINLYVQTQRDKKIMTGLALTGIGTIPALFGRFALSSREKQLEEALTKRFGEGWENSEAFKSISEASILDKAKSALSDAFDNAFTKEGRDAYYENYKAKYDTASHPFSRGVESVLTAREQQAFDNAVSSGNSSVARHYAIINQARAKLKSAVESGMTKEEMRGIGLSSFDIERGMRLYKKKPKTEETPVVSGVQETIDQTGSTFVPTSDAQPSVQTDIVAGLGSQGYRSEEDIIEKQREAAREAAAAERRKDRRREKRKAEAKKAADKRKKAITKAKSISKSVKGKGAKAISASKSKSSGPFAKGGLASRRK